MGRSVVAGWRCGCISQRSTRDVRNMCVCTKVRRCEDATADAVCFDLDVPSGEEYIDMGHPNKISYDTHYE